MMNVLDVGELPPRTFWDEIAISEEYKVKVTMFLAGAGALEVDYNNPKIDVWVPDGKKEEFSSRVNKDAQASFGHDIGQLIDIHPPDRIFGAGGDDCAVRADMNSLVPPV
eukprot:m.98843 g.98843  ORF g.98843 m.98843 type:complete len:110 (+) comp12445_c0_seq4:1046-1375(+)